MSSEIMEAVLNTIKSIDDDVIRINLYEALIEKTVATVTMDDVVKPGRITAG